MSNESSASETTPLRRPDDRYNINSLQQTSPPLTPSSSTTFNNYQTRNPSSVRNNLTSSLTDPINLASTTVAISNHNNNNIEVHLSSSHQHQQHLNNNNNNSNSEIFIKMETNKRILYRVGLDVLILLCVGFPILCFFLWGDSYKRGFFCDDESLMHPFKESTVKSWMLYIIGLVLPISVILIVEIIQSKNHEKLTNGNSTARRYVFMDYEIPDWMVECYKKIGIFGFGAAVSQLTTDIAKYSIGRLRPHFIDVCQPIMPDHTTCADPKNLGKYITDFTCGNPYATKRMLKEVRLSFPSGHSSFTFYTMVYVALYLQSRMTWRGSKLLRHFLQFALIMIAWYTALTRVSDYKHHWSDVLAGSAIGSLVAVIVRYLVPDNWFNWNTVWPTVHNKDI
ncbi:putative phosphatidate phosphatase isoform X2 [Lucilia cuprina]|uniref:putative phosphatidate phosphatase isoform X2 n=1 Tax=Lucilia cuprina TaxID=7375 RepID=UPI001F058CDC|nr:putative phosphatidate phosphatase isoform X2 [Lucilia cuprina]